MFVKVTFVYSFLWSVCASVASERSPVSAKRSLAQELGLVAAGQLFFDRELNLVFKSCVFVSQLLVHPLNVGGDDVPATLCENVRILSLVSFAEGDNNHIVQSRISFDQVIFFCKKCRFFKKQKIGFNADTS